MARIDYVVMAVFFAVLFGVAARVSRRRASGEQFFMAGHSLTWLYIGFAMIAINVGARYVIGFAGRAYSTGVIFGHYEVVSTLNLIVLAFILLPIYRASGIYTMPQLLRHRFGDATHLLYSIIAIVAIFLTVPAGTCLLSKTLSGLTGTNMWVYVALIVPTCMLLQMWGGLRSVAFTNVMMGVVIILGGAVVTWAALSHEAVGGLSGLVEKIRAVDPELLEGFREGGFIPWPAVFTGIFVIGLWFWCIDQTRMQLMLAARTLNDARRGALLLAFLKYVTAFIVLVPGMCGRLIYPDLPEPDGVYGLLLRDLISPIGYGLLGLVVAGLAAAVISTLMSLLNAAATIFTNDVFKRLVAPERFERRAILSSRMFAVFAGVLTFAGVALYAQHGAVMRLMLTMYSLVAGPTLAVYLMGMCWRRANGRGAVFGLIVGMGFSFGAELAGRLAVLVPHPEGMVRTFCGYAEALRSINPHYRALIALGLSCATLVAISLVGKPPEAHRIERTTFAWYFSRRREIEALAATPAGHEGEPLKDPWYLDYRLWSVCLLVLLFATWWTFGLGRIFTGFH